MCGARDRWNVLLQFYVFAIVWQYLWFGYIGKTLTLVCGLVLWTHCIVYGLHNS